MIKLFSVALIALLSIGCSTRMGQPLQYSYEGYYKHKISDVSSEIVKADMLNCGFESVFNNINMLVNNKND
ncbi:hypothetical protein [Acinetobacter sp. c3-l95]